MSLAKMKHPKFRCGLCFPDFSLYHEDLFLLHGLSRLDPTPGHISHCLLMERLLGYPLELDHLHTMTQSLFVSTCGALTAIREASHCLDDDCGLTSASLASWFLWYNRHIIINKVPFIWTVWLAKSIGASYGYTLSQTLNRSRFHTANVARKCLFQYQQLRADDAATKIGFPDRAF